MRVLLIITLLLAGGSGCAGKKECSQPADCDDANPCTEERCRFERCSWLSIPGCCQTGADCLAGQSCNTQTQRCGG